MTSVAQPVTNDPIVEQAADWIVRLTADNPGERILAQAGYDAWKQADINVEDGRVIVAGQRVRISADNIGPVEGIDVRSVQESWKFHQLVVADRPLPDVLDELSRHRPGHIQYRREKLADIKVSAVLPLNDTDKALQLLAASFPNLRIRTMTPYLVMVDVPAS